MKFTTIIIGTNHIVSKNSFSKSSSKYPKVFDKKVKLSKVNQKLDFHMESSEKIKCMVRGLASWLAQPNFCQNIEFEIVCVG